ncbi:hypothetical protein [Chlorobium sp. N1]|uniref:hypothetical protein n=1 Tax=Chlorobium sp. N1 TaxID=2491138 RepID=UPI0010390CC7|nr:hypothetical protein [Chlorobium sp. N1]TCD47080.1 hypothetical protein E0L29_10005 [Chlorobium sp. N1]
MKTLQSAVLAAIVACSLLLRPAGDLRAWHDRTHLAIAWAAGFDRWYSAAAPDVAKSKYPCGAFEGPNHYAHNPEGKPLTAEAVLSQAERYDRTKDGDGHLYGAIVASVRKYRELRERGKFPDYAMVYCSHYVGDLSMPLHNVAYDEFNRRRHHAGDAVIEDEAFGLAPVIRSRIYPISISSEQDLAREIARIGELSRTLALDMQRQGRDMTRREAIVQAVHSASLLRAILVYAGCPVQDRPESILPRLPEGLRVK